MKLWRTLMSCIPIVIALLLQIPSPSDNSVDQAHANTYKARHKDRAEPIGQPIINLRDGKSGTESNHYQYQATPDPSRGFWTPERITAFATGIYAVAAIFTLLAILHQGKYMRLALAETKVAANAAVVSADTAKQALMLLEGADVVVSDMRFSTGDLMTATAILVFRVYNCGRSRAEQLRVTGEFSTSKGTLPLVTLPVSRVLGASEYAEFSTQKLVIYTDWLTLSVVDDINKGRQALAVKFWVKYVDVFGRACTGEGIATYGPIVDSGGYRQGFTIVHTQILRGQARL